MENWKENPIYKTLERIANNAGINITYQKVHNDIIDGEIWARADIDSQSIMMPENEDEFPDASKACLILGHEIGHILSGLDSPDDSTIREINENNCNLIGTCLLKLAEMTYEKEMQDYITGL